MKTSETISLVENGIIPESIPQEKLTELHSEMIKVMKEIRKTTPQLNVIENQAKLSEIWEGCIDGNPIKRVIIYLRSSGCFWAIKTKPAGEPNLNAGCLDCEHSLLGTTFGKSISVNSYIEQFLGEYKKFNFKNYPMLCVYNEGNFFNERELPVEARREILKIIGADPNIKVVVIESLPEFIKEKVMLETTTLLGNKRLEVGIGLESSNQTVRKLCVNKPYTLRQFEEIVPVIKRYAHLLTYVMIKPSFLTEAEALNDALLTVKYAFDVGAQIVSLEPVNIGEFAMSGVLNKIGYYRPAWLWTVLEVAKLSHNLIETRIGGYQFAPNYKRFAQNCNNCTMMIKDAIRQFNSTYEIKTLEDLNCKCKIEWENELNKTYPPLIERLPEVLRHLKHYLKNLNNNYVHYE